MTDSAARRVADQTMSATRSACSTLVFIALRTLRLTPSLVTHQPVLTSKAGVKCEVTGKAGRHTGHALGVIGVVRVGAIFSALEGSGVIEIVGGGAGEAVEGRRGETGGALRLAEETEAIVRVVGRVESLTVTVAEVDFQEVVGDAGGAVC